MPSYLIILFLNLILLNYLETVNILKEIWIKFFVISPSPRKGTVDIAIKPWIPLLLQLFSWWNCCKGAGRIGWQWHWNVPFMSQHTNCPWNCDEPIPNKWTSEQKNPQWINSLPFFSSGLAFHIQCAEMKEYSKMYLHWGNNSIHVWKVNYQYSQLIFLYFCFRRIPWTSQPHLQHF